MFEISDEKAKRLEAEHKIKTISKSKEVLKTIVMKNMNKEILTTEQLEALMFFIRTVLR